MKYIQYYSIENGAYSFFNILENVSVEIIQDNNKWESAKLIIKSLNTIAVPTWQYAFDSILHLASWLVGEMNRDGHYVIAGRNCEQDSRYDFLYQGDQLSSYCSTFGIAYSPTPFIKKIHHWTGIKKDPILPDWLQAMNPNIYQISK